jgi:pyridoxine 4-dehydrogenase
LTADRDPDPGGRLPLRLAQRPEQLRASVEDNLRSLGVDQLPVVNLRRLDSGPGLRPEGDQEPAGIACVQNAYSLVSRDDEDMLRLCVAEGIAWVPFFPLGGAFPGLPKATDEPAVDAVAESLGVTPSQVGLAWLLRHAPNVLLSPAPPTPPTSRPTWRPARSPSTP